MSTSNQERVASIVRDETSRLDITVDHDRKRVRLDAMFFSGIWQVDPESGLVLTREEAGAVWLALEEALNAMGPTQECDQCGAKASVTWKSWQCCRHPFGSCDGKMRPLEPTEDVMASDQTETRPPFCRARGPSETNNTYECGYSDGRADELRDVLSWLLSHPDMTVRDAYQRLNKAVHR